MHCTRISLWVRAQPTVLQECDGGAAAVWATVHQGRSEELALQVFAGVVECVNAVIVLLGKHS